MKRRALEMLRSALLAAWPTLCAAQAPQAVVYGGVESSASTYYAYSGWLQPVAGGTLGAGPFVRAGASLLGYQYDTVIGGQDARVRARAPGVELAAGWAFGSPAAGGDLSLAVGVRELQLSTEDPGARLRGTTGYLAPQVSLHLRATSGLEATLLANAATRLDSRFARARLGWRVERWTLGPELQLSKGPEYRDQRAGVHVSVTLPDGWGLGAQAGRARDIDRRRDGYFGLSVSRAF